MSVRSLVLAGGGMRVAWQAGVMVALEEAGLEFAHVDGTSGGIINAAMLLSGCRPRDMCERWSTLDVKRFASPLRLQSYLRGPTGLGALGDADGIIDHVFPHLGIDVERIRARREPLGTFNVCNFDDKTCVAVPNAEVDLDLLVAGISLPIMMPVVRRGDTSYTDAVWIKDANLLEAVRRGSRELWLAWCIGNTDRFGDGPLEQYVHMIEMSANGALIEELDRIRERNEAGLPADAVRLHVIKPRRPLPLDPVLFLGRIDAHTLCGMGYRDARRYLASMSETGVALDHTATRMEEPPLGVRFRETFRGRLPGRGRIELRLGVELAEPDGTIVGSVILGNGARRWLWDGEARLEQHQLVYHAMVGDEPVVVRRGLGLGGLRRATVTVGEEHGEVALTGPDAVRAVLSIEPDGAHGLSDRVGAVRAFVGGLRGA